MTLRRVCVFCGSSAGTRAEYVDAATSLGNALADEGIALVYGGTKVGLMGAVADAVLRRGGEVMGIITDELHGAGIGHTTLSSLEIVDDMHARKARMAVLADGFVALPGGFGTWEELCEVVTWNQLGIHSKPVVLFDVAGYWDGFLAFATHAADEGFVRPQHRELLRVATTAEAVIKQLHVAMPPVIPKWAPRPG